MGRTSYRQRLATQFTQPRLSTPEGTIFVPPQPVDLERFYAIDPGAEESPDPSLSAFEHLLELEQYHLILSLAWRCGQAYRTLDLGMLRTESDKLFVVHQLNDDVGTSLIVAYLSTSVPHQLFGLFLVDYLSSRGTAYAVSLPDVLPHTIWIARPELAPHAAVAAGLFGLVTPGGADALAARQLGGETTWPGPRREGGQLLMA